MCLYLMWFICVDLLSKSVSTNLLLSLLAGWHCAAVTEAQGAKTVYKIMCCKNMFYNLHCQWVTETARNYVPDGSWCNVLFAWGFFKELSFFFLFNFSFVC